MLRRSSRVPLPAAPGREFPTLIGSTIGNAIAGGIQQRAAERDLRRAGVEQSADKFEDQFGDTPEVAAYRKAGLAAANHPGRADARANFNQSARTLLGANSSDPEVAAFLSHTNPSGPPVQADDIVVTADRDYLFGSTIDNAGIWVGEKGNELKQGVGQFIQKNPGVGIALTLADAAFAVVAPAKYLGGMVLDAFKDQAAGYIADKMEGPRLWAPEKAPAGGSGFVLAGGIALGGLGALKGVAGAGAMGFPANNGFLGASTKIRLEPGQVIDRYGGYEKSKFFSPAGTPLSARSLPPATASQPLRTFEVVKPFHVKSGTVAPWYGETGLGTQYRAPAGLQKLIDRGFLKETTK